MKMKKMTLITAACAAVVATSAFAAMSSTTPSTGVMQPGIPGSMPYNPNLMASTCIAGFTAKPMQWDKTKVGSEYTCTSAVPVCAPGTHLEQNVAPISGQLFNTPGQTNIGYDEKTHRFFYKCANDLPPPPPK